MTDQTQVPDKKNKILAADDDPDIGEMLQERLVAEGYEVTLVSNGEQALEKVRTEKPNLIILDASMPKIDGWAVCKNLKANPATQAIPVIMLTARTQSIDELRGWESGVNEYLTKPYDNAQLVETVTRLLPKE